MRAWAVARRLARAIIAVAFPMLVWGVGAALAWVFPAMRQEVFANALVVLAAVVFGFVVLVKGLRLRVGMLLAFVYFPAMYVLVMYLEAVVGYRLYGTYF